MASTASATRRIGVIMHGVTGRMGHNQHLVRSILAMRDQGGVALRDGSTIVPDPILVGRDAVKVARLAKTYGIDRFTTDVERALGDARDEVFFDAATTAGRAGVLRRAIAAGKHVYCEKPLATSLADALELYRAAERAGVRHGVVQDKLWLPGLRKLKRLISAGFFGRVLSVRGEFGYWVFEGDVQPAQRPSWNYKKEQGGGIVADMLPHWRYVLDNLFGEVRAVSCLGATHVHERWDESGEKYPSTAEDAVYATFELAGGVVAHFNSSWCVRVRRDDLLTLQVDGTHGSAVVGLRRCFVQPRACTPRPVWNPDLEQPIDFFGGWQPMPDDEKWDNAFKVQWEQFLAHVAGVPVARPGEEEFRATFLEGARGVQLVELATESWTHRRWVDVPALDGTSPALPERGRLDE
jgi:predicted dehydrogenase